MISDSTGPQSGLSCFLLRLRVRVWAQGFPPRLRVGGMPSPRGCHCWQKPAPARAAPRPLCLRVGRSTRGPSAASLPDLRPQLLPHGGPSPPPERPAAPLASAFTATSVLTTSVCLRRLGVSAMLGRTPRSAQPDVKGTTVTSLGRRGSDPPTPLAASLGTKDTWPRPRGVSSRG